MNSEVRGGPHAGTGFRGPGPEEEEEGRAAQSWKEYGLWSS